MMLHRYLDKFSKKFWDKHPSVYVTLAAWGVMALTAEPNFGSIMVHLTLSTTFLLAIVLLARHEGWRKGRGL
jgi:hypothetical protein